ncbi:MAG: hypothetical protein AAF413_02000 [Patescibacteria group bacterium]
MRETAPTDHLGIPYVIVGKLGKGPGTNNRHHHWHVKADYKGPWDSGLPALRSSRTQKVSVWDHSSYHAHFYGVPRPETRLERFGAALLCNLGYVPRLGVSFHGDAYSVVSVSKRVRRRLWESGEIASNTSASSKFILSEVLRYATKIDADPVLLEELCLSSNEQRCRYIAKQLLLDAARAGTDPIRQDYMRAWRSGRLPRAVQRGGQKYTAPRHPEQAVVRHILGTRDTTSLVDSLRCVLAA